MNPTTSSDDDDDDDRAALFELPPGADPTIDWGLASHLHPDGSPRIIERHLIVRDDFAGLRLDHFVKTQIERLSRTKIQQVIAEQLTRSDGHRLKPATIVAAGEHYLIRRVAKPEPPCPRTFGVVHASARVYIVDKPAHLPVHASAKFYFNTLTRVMSERWPDEPELQLCHRLDRETSGCLVVARDREAASILKQAFEKKTAVTKEYLAIVHGSPPAAWDAGAVIQVPMRISQPGDATKLPHVRMIPGPGGQEAVTRVRIERRGTDYTLVRCTLITGRQHQIRLHLADAGFPIVGDKLYAHGDDAFMTFCDRGLTPELAARFVLPRHALHAAHVVIPDPDDKTRAIAASAPLPADMVALLST